MKSITRKVMILSTSEGIWGGSQIFNEGLCFFLESKGFDATLATASPELYSCKTMRIGSISSRLKRVAVSLKLARAMNRDQEEVIILDDLSGLWLAPIFFFFRIKVCSILHLELKRKDRWGFGHSWLTFHLLRLSARFTDQLFSVGKSNLDRFPVEADFIGNFVPRAFLEKSQEATKRYDLGTISRFVPQKNLRLFLYLVSNINRISPRPITAVLVGDGPQKGDLLKLAEELDIGRVLTFLPWIERHQVPAMLDQIRCFVLTSYHEGFATSLLESHARGLPALVTESSGFGPDFVRGFGSPTGIVYEEEDVWLDSFLRSSLDLIESHTSFRRNCVKKATQFSESAVLGKVERALISLFEST